MESKRTIKIADVDVIKKLSSLTDQNIKRVRTLVENKSCYTLDDDEHVVGLSLYNTYGSLKNCLPLLKQLPRLESLYMTSNELTEINSLRDLKSLRKLVLSNSVISSIEGIGELDNIEYLDLSFNEIVDVSPVRYLSKLEYLDLSSNPISNIPMLELINLKSFLISNCEVSDILAVKYLINLENLDISYNSISDIRSIKNLQKLNRLNLNKNNVETVSAIEKLNNLVWLELKDNFVKELLPLYNLEKLRLVDLRFNPIAYLPEWITRFKCSIKWVDSNGIGVRDVVLKEGLIFFNNPIENVPIEIMKRGKNAIVNYFNSFRLDKTKKSQEVFLYEAKMVIVGRGGVGKTALAKRLTDENYQLSQIPTTEGISIIKRPYEFKLNGLQDTDFFKFNIWDFGGQEKYDATHQLFITHRSIYLFLTDAREESNYLDFYYWLNTIKVFGNNSPVVVVLSKCDERQKLLPTNTYQELFKNIVQFVNLSCVNGYENTVDDIKEAIKNAIFRLPQTKDKLPKQWILVRRELETTSIKKDYVDYTRYLAICRKNGLTAKQADFLSQYLNDLGVIVHHQHDLLLKKTVFTNTDWCVDGMYKVLDDKIIFSNKGKFTMKDLTKVWSEPRFSAKQAELLKLLQEYNLCFELNDKTAYIAPDLLPPNRPENLVWDSAANLFFEYRYEFMPAGILSRFIVKSHELIKENYYWKYGVVLQYDNTIAIVEEDYLNKKIKISVKGLNKKGLLSAIRVFMDYVNDTLDKDKKLIISEMVPCDCRSCKQSKSPHFYQFSMLKRFVENNIAVVNCPVSTKSVVIQTLINDIDYSQDFTTEEDLKNHILDLISDELEYTILSLQGYVNFWRDQKCQIPKNEIEIAPYVHGVLEPLCIKRGIHQIVEPQLANGNVDVVFSYTNRYLMVLKVCMEIKFAHHRRVVTSLETQLLKYMEDAKSKQGIYLIFWLKNSNHLKPRRFNKVDDLFDEVQASNPQPNNVSTIIINCNKPTPPSRTKFYEKR